ncbi:MAG: hypothetical protein HY043_18135 [Verrucomicrobia bacterium]|nr:hypothetical protein [Verrucomicrobiota bacterium]
MDSVFLAMSSVNQFFLSSNPITKGMLVTAGLIGNRQRVLSSTNTGHDFSAECRPGKLLAEGALAVEMGETMMECAEMFFGHATHALARKKVE